MTEPKLLTEAEVHDLYKCVADASDLVRLLRKHGLIAPEPEPVDPLLIEAREICASVDGSEDFLDGLWDHGVTMKIALTALRRGKELAERPTPAPKYPVPEGQTHLDDYGGHRYLDVIREGEAAFDSKSVNPYHCHSLEYVLHVVGWLKREFSVALDKANAERPTLTREMVREAVEIAFSPTRWPVDYIDTMHAALVERLK